MDTVRDRTSYWENAKEQGFDLSWLSQLEESITRDDVDEFSSNDTGRVEGSIPRNNVPRFGAYTFRPVEPGLRLEQILCFKHRRRVARDDTVKFHKHTLQILPSQQRRSYAGAVVVVLEALDGRLSLQHEGRIIASQDAPPSPGALRTSQGSSASVTVPPPDPKDPANSTATVPELLKAKMHGTKNYDPDLDDKDVAAMSVTATPRKSTFLQRERWKAVQEAKRRGLSIRGMARELGIHRETVRRYIDADSPPTRRPPQPTSDTIAQ